MILGMTAMTTIKVPTSARDLLKERANEAGMTQGAYLEHAMRELRRLEMLRELATWEPDEEYLAEAREWDQADLAPSLREYPA